MTQPWCVHVEAPLLLPSPCIPCLIPYNVNVCVEEEVCRKEMALSRWSRIPYLPPLSLTRSYGCASI